MRKKVCPIKKKRIDYYSFGMLMPNRHESSDKYRYGFQGQEKDDEVKGEGNSLNYKYRMHDPRVGRFFAVDPLTKKYPHYTPYSFSGNKVIHAVELEGLEEVELNSGIPNGRKVRGYMVQNGDNLTKIAESTNTDLGELIRVNSEAGRIESKDLIYPGDILLLEDTSFIGVDDVSGMNYDRDQNYGDWYDNDPYIQQALNDRETIETMEFGVGVIMMVAGEGSLVAARGASSRSNGLVPVRGYSPSSTAPNTKSISTPYGNANQGSSSAAISARPYVQSGGKLFRIGTLGRSQTAEAQFWATENPLANPKAFAKKYGIPIQNISNADFIEVGVLKPNTSFVTRAAPPAPGSAAGSGGGIEVVTPANGVKLESFIMIK